MAGPVTASWNGPDELVRGVASSLTITTTRDGAALNISAATATLYKPDGSVASTGSATVSSNTATFSVLGTVTSSEDPGEGWRVAWVLTLSGGIAWQAQNTVEVVLYSVACPVAPADLLRREEALTNIEAGSPTALLADAILEAWRTVRSSLRQKGRRPYLVLSSADVYEVVVCKALELAYRRVAVEAESVEAAKAAEYREQYREAWAALTFEEADPSTYASSGVRRGANPTLTLGSGQVGTGRYRPTWGRL